MFVEHVGRYEIREEVARGGMGVVYRAWDPEAAREVAIKVLVGGRGANQPQRQRFLREGRALARLSHRNVVRVFDVGEDRGRPYLVLEYVPGQSLEELLRRGGPLPPERAVEITLKLAEALEYIHQEGVLHRDLKPANVLLDDRGEPRLADFGLTRDRDASLSGTVLTQAGYSLGTPGYWSPEQALGDLQAIGPATDVYGLGATFYALLTGVPPHGEAQSLQRAVDTIQQTPRPPSSTRSQLPRALDPLCLRCLAGKPADRYPSAGAVAEALAQYQRGRSQDGAPRSKQTQLLLLAVALLLVGAAFGGAAAVWSSAEEPFLPASPSTASTEPRPTPTPSERAPSETPRENIEAAQALLERGAEKLDDGDVAGAIKEFSWAIKLDPSNSSIYYHRGVARELLRDYEGSLEDFTHAAELDPDAFMAYFNRGIVRNNYGDYRGAIKDYTRALDIDPNHARTYYSRGSARRRLEDQAGAIEDFTRAIELDPGYARAYANRGETRLLGGDREGALADYTQALAVLPANDSFRSVVEELIAEAKAPLPR